MEEQTRASLVEALIGTSTSLSPPLELVGKALVPSRNNRTTLCAVVSTTTTTAAANQRRRQQQQQQQSSSTSADDDRTRTQPCLLVPLDPSSGSGQLKLLECALRRKPLSKSVLLRLNAWLVNRDNAMFDNVPWSTWTIDPQHRNYDAANNSILPRFHLGKRDAYNRFLGKDWHGKSAAIGNLALRLKYALDGQSIDPPNESGDDMDDDEGVTTMAEGTETSPISLGQRILQLQIREQEMDLAELEYQIAVAKQQRDSVGIAVEEELTDLEGQTEQVRQELHKMRTQLQILETPELSTSPASSSSSFAFSWVSQALQDLANRTTNYGQNAAPYRGATGYAPLLDTPQDLIDSCTYQYTSPYDLLVDILNDQLRAEVIGAILENTSLLEGSVTLGGAIVLRRIVPDKTVTLAGEQLTIPDTDEDFGNRGITGGETFLVECDADEAIGLSLACEVPLRVESDVWERSSVMMFKAESSESGIANEPNAHQTLPLWKSRDPRMTLLLEGQATNQSSTGRAFPLRIPRTTVSLFDSLFKPRSSSSSSPRAVFPSDNPIQTLESYDQLSPQDKARTLLTMSNFDGRLPRPRVVRQSPTILDDLLVPLIDESTRRQYYIRDAQRRGDTARVEELEQQKSRRQVAKEQANLARERGADDEAQRWDQEAELFAALRADVTQDEGSYSRFL